MVFSYILLNECAHFFSLSESPLPLRLYLYLSFMMGSHVYSWDYFGSVFRDHMTLAIETKPFHTCMQIMYAAHKKINNS